jgi:hypothetical protein
MMAPGWEVDPHLHQDRIPLNLRSPVRIRATCSRISIAAAHYPFLGWSPDPSSLLGMLRSRRGHGVNDLVTVARRPTALRALVWSGDLPNPPASPCLGPEAAITASMVLQVLVAIKIQDSRSFTSLVLAANFSSESRAHLLITPSSPATSRQSTSRPSTTHEPPT